MIWLVVVVCSTKLTLKWNIEYLLACHPSPLRGGENTILKACAET